VALVTLAAPLRYHLVRFDTVVDDTILLDGGGKEATMKLILAMVTTIVLSGLSAPAQAELWCLRDFGASRGVCVFPSAQDCVRAAMAGGGRCERDIAVQEQRERKNSPNAAVRRNRSAVGRYD
jgi:hypothetical protein